MKPNLPILAVQSQDESPLEVGEMIILSSSHFDMDNRSGKFSRNCKYLGDVRGKLKATWDDENYDPSRNNYSGAYRYYEYEVVEVL